MKGLVIILMLTFVLVGFVGAAAAPTSGPDMASAVRQAKVVRISMVVGVDNINGTVTPQVVRAGRGATF